MGVYENRRRTLCQMLSTDGLIAVNNEHSDPVTLHYLSGFTGEGALLVCPDRTLLLTDSRYTEQARIETSGIEVEEVRAWYVRGAADALERLGVAHVTFLSPRVSHDWVQRFGAACKAEMSGERDLVKEIRAIKTDEEIDALQRAARIADEALEQLASEIRVGMNEVEIALRLEMLIRNRDDSEGLAFPINASAGPNTALAHYNPLLGRRALEAGDLLLFDFGACCNGYRSDMTRTLAVGHSTDKAAEIYDIVLQANLVGIDAVKAGVVGSDVDGVARKLISGRGYAEHFGHGLGHGIGLEVHEAPRLSPQSEDVLKPRMVVTVEPGIYLTGFGGVRIEDDVVVTESGCDILTAFPKEELIVVG